MHLRSELERTEKGTSDELELEFHAAHRMCTLEVGSRDGEAAVRVRYPPAHQQLAAAMCCCERHGGGRLAVLEMPVRTHALVQHQHAMPLRSSTPDRRATELFDRSTNCKLLATSVSDASLSATATTPAHLPMPTHSEHFDSGVRLPLRYESLDSDSKRFDTSALDCDDGTRIVQMKLRRSLTPCARPCRRDRSTQTPTESASSTPEAAPVEEFRNASVVRLLASDILALLRSNSDRHSDSAAPSRFSITMSLGQQLALFGVGVLVLGVLLLVAAVTFYDAYQIGDGDLPQHVSLWRTGQHWLSHAFANEPPL